MPEFLIFSNFQFDTFPSNDVTSLITQKCILDSINEINVEKCGIISMGKNKRIVSLKTINFFENAIIAG